MHPICVLYINDLSIHILLYYQTFHICDANVNNALSRRNVNRWKDRPREIPREENAEKNKQQTKQRTDLKCEEVRERENVYEKQ